MKISVITAVFNCRETIDAMLDSVSRQDYGHIEHIVVDGASTDGTIEVLNARNNEIDVLVSERDQGIYYALNKGVRLATGDVIGFLHADDVFADNHVVSRIAAALVNPDVDAVYGDLEYVSSARHGRVVRRWHAGDFSRGQLKWGWMPPHPTFYVRRAVYERFGLFDTKYRIAADYDLMLRFLGSGSVNPVYLSDVLVKMRLGGVSNRSIGNILRKSLEDYQALRHHGIGGFGGIGALVWKNLSKVPQFFR